MSRTSSNTTQGLRAYFLETSAQAAVGDGTPPDRHYDGHGPTTEPLAGRRLRQALADLGPAQPAAAAAAAPETGGLPRPVPPPPRPQRAAPAEAALPTPPAGALPPTVPFNTERPDAAANLPAGALTWPAFDAAPHPFAAPPAMAPQPVEAFERPPMIIERAHIERELRAVSPMAPLPRPSPLPALAIGVAMALATGVALYLFLMVA